MLPDVSDFDYLQGDLIVIILYCTTIFWNGLVDTKQAQNDTIKVYVYI